MVESHFLVFTDLIGSCSDETLPCSPQPANLTSTLFIREEKKKSSFSLSNTVELRIRSSPEGREPIDLTNENSINELNTTCSTKSAGESRDHIATASISYCASVKGDGVDVTPSNQVFLFGGFELIASINSVQVFVNRAGRTSDLKVKEAEEEYLTSCKGIPARDLPPLEQESQGICVDSQLNEMKVNDWFKFVLASPGGAKPVYRVRLEFRLTPTDQNAIIRTLKVKCRLNDAGPTSSGQHSFNTAQRPKMENPTIGIQNLDNLASMMAIMGNTSAMSSISQFQNSERVVPHHLTGMGNTNNLTSLMAMMTSMTEGINTTPTLTTEPSIYSQTQQQHEKYQSEIISSITGLGMFLKSSEEKTRNSFEAMLAQMEDRVMQKLDTLSNRLSAIENQISSVASLRHSDDCNVESCSDDADQNVTQNSNNET